MKKHFEKELPEGYDQVFYINAKEKKTGIIFNAVGFFVMAAVMLIALIPIFLSETVSLALDPLLLLIFDFALLFSIVLYIILHELVHGIAYKVLTHEKLTFGLSWSCAFCGVPNVYTYRHTAIVALAAPLTLFTLLFVPLTVALYFVHPVYYLGAAALLALHLGGCAGDIYCLYLCLFKFRSKKLLIRDTGPEQFFYLPQ